MAEGAPLEIVAADIGGTHARFAIARIEAGRVAELRSQVVLKAAHYASLQTAWESYAQQIGAPLPRAGSIAVACPVVGDLLRLTNNPWTLRRSLLKQQLGLDELLLLNDFEAVGHAVTQIGAADLAHLCGPQSGLPETGVVSVIGPGTGLGVAEVILERGKSKVIATEASHISFAPLDAIEDAILAHLRRQHARVSVERVVSGPGLANIYEALSTLEGRPVSASDDKTLWETALKGDDSLASAALERFCLCFGAFAGDIVLAHGAAALVIAGGLGHRLTAILPRSGFAARFTAKGRFETMMGGVPVMQLTHPQPGLLGAAVAFAGSHGV
jgi:glucokinase